ncbi:hypothetical protein, partial [Thermomonas haemolytica]
SGRIFFVPVDTSGEMVTPLFDASVEDLLGTQAKRSAGKRGPQPKIAQQLERIQALPAAEQRAIVKVLDAVLAAHQ